MRERSLVPGAGERAPAPAAPSSTVDFAYAFAPPHRMTVCRPGHADKTLLDVEPGKLTLTWSYEKLADFPLYIWKAPHLDWSVEIRVMVAGELLQQSRWTRDADGVPCLVNTYEQDGVRCVLEVVGGATAALVRATVENTGPQAQTFSLRCEHKGGWVISNPAWIDGRNADTLLAMQNERPDRILVLGVGADVCPFRGEAAMAPGGGVPMPDMGAAGQAQTNWAKTTMLQWELAPGQKRDGWIVRPYAAYAAELPALRQRDWRQEFDAARQEWRDLLGRAAAVRIPDPGVAHAFRACLADLFVMREPLAQGYVGVCPGTAVYRSSNGGEPCLTAILLDQLGFHDAAAAGLRIHLETQEEDGDWTDPKGWGHHCWGVAGFKAWAAMEHYRLTGDRDFLRQVYPRLRASSRWQEARRASTRVLEHGQRPVTYGLMPRGMGDCGMMNGNDYFGVFYPWNFLAVFADRLAVEAAEILGRDGDLSELRQIQAAAVADLLASLETGAIQEHDHRWIPGAPNQPGGSSWGALLAVYPTGLLDGQNPLVPGTFRQIEKSISPGGHPVGTGWMQDGCWVAATLDNVAEARLALGDGDGACRYLYPTLNHATPLVTWCEERGIAAGTPKTSGDLQHLWTPLAVCRYLRDALVMEHGDGLELALGTPREWLGSGGTVGITDAPTHFGRISYAIRYDPATHRVTGTVVFPEPGTMKWAILHLRLPNGLKINAINAASGATVLPAADGIKWLNPHGQVNLS